MARCMDGSKWQNLMKENAAIKKGTMARGLNGGKWQNLLQENTTVKEDTMSRVHGRR